MWFKTHDNLINPETEEINDWKKVAFPINFNTKKMYTMGKE